MKKSPLYTRTGDDGTTSLVNGSRAPKTHPRIEAYGTIDEFSSLLGIVIASPECPQQQRTLLHEIQNQLFNIGCYLATPSTPDAPTSLYGLTTQALEHIEHAIDELDQAVPPVNAFVLPGGSLISAHCHVARSVCRRAERRIYTLAETEHVNPLVTKYINRLSDYLFILAKYVNHILGIPELTWIPAK